MDPLPPQADIDEMMNAINDDPYLKAKAAKLYNPVQGPVNGAGRVQVAAAPKQ
jgi:hypothetical protein